MKKQNSQNPIDIHGKISIKWTYGMVAIITYLVILILYFWKNEYRTEILFGASFLGVTVALYSGIYAVRQSRYNYDMKLMDNSINYLRNLNSERMTIIRSTFETEFKPSKSDEDKYNKVKSEYASLVYSLLGELEDLSIGIQYGYYNEYIIHDSLHDFVKWIYRNFKFYIDRERKERNVPEFMCELEKLNNAWVADKFLYNS